MPAGIVPTAISQPKCSSGSSDSLRLPMLRSTAAMIRSQSRQKKVKSATAVPRWRTTTKATKLALFGSPDFHSSQPSSAGTSTLWPRLETGKSSNAPCNRLITIAWSRLIAPRHLVSRHLPFFSKPYGRIPARKHSTASGQCRVSHDVTMRGA